MLSIKNIHANIDGKQILNGINLEINAGEVHAIMGPNGSGKSTLALVMAGREEYEVTEGSITFMGKNILELSPEDRAHEGLFLAFQYPETARQPYFPSEIHAHQTHCQSSLAGSHSAVFQCSLSAPLWRAARPQQQRSLA